MHSTHTTCPGQGVMHSTHTTCPGQGVMHLPEPAVMTYDKRDQKRALVASQCREDMIADWNTRPIEDALRTRIAQLEAVARDVQRLQACWPNPGLEQREAVILLSDSMRKAGFEPIQAARRGRA